MPTFLPRFLILLTGLALAEPGLAAVYRDPQGAVRFVVPDGWRVRTQRQDGVRQWKLVPPKADQRERAAIDVLIKVRPARGNESLDRLARRLKKGEGDREPALSLQYNKTEQRLFADVREGGFVSGRLWIMRREYRLYQKVGRKTMIEARCSATAAEFGHVRRALSSICASVRPDKP
ncbi:hypothetical protein [Crenobacter cavernae]|uniref:DUF1795 domain-containing protein n=1 Tax=Crenobacter cavernae TaxID=2290923 RepID=A0ABY0FHC2_9NEIS|nr:hypothetical protein [Crenobacter cavernae]RXZ44302.1 hypothetical protein EBB06_07135 [Crenobacter cavernae]